MRGVPSQEIKHTAGEEPVRKRDEKESHYSRHMSSKASFGMTNALAAGVPGTPGHGHDDKDDGEEPQIADQE